MPDADQPDRPPWEARFERADDLQALAALQDEEAADDDPDASSLIAGRYQVLSTLGQGGMGIVYRVRDTRLGRTVALKTILPRALTNAQASRRFFREAEALARLDHPHILTLYDSGNDGEVHFLVMQLGGRDLTRVLEQHGGRLPLPVALHIGQAVARALAYAHTRGIIHRDLKPANILIGAADDPSGTPLTAATTVKVMDFGLAKIQGASALTVPQAQLGTPQYMAPEQVLGREADARADLYALGVLLYELVAGVRPFDGDDVQAILSQHLNLEPVPPSVFNDEVPRALETLILRLLEKDPAKRPASADEAVGVLEEINLAPRPTSVVQPNATPPQAGGSSAASALYRRTFAGRESELRQLRAAYDTAAAGQGALVMVVGEPGIGKTALCEQLAAYAAQRGGLALWGHSYEEGSQSLPYLPFVEALRTYVQASSVEALREELGQDAAEVARIVPTIQERLGVELRPAGDPDEARWRLLEAVTGFLKSAAQRQPIVLLLEDLHWADRGTLDLLLHVARNLAGARLLVVGSYRNVEVDRAHPLSKTLAELRRIGAFARLLLSGLDTGEVQRMLEAITGHEVAPAFVEAVQRQTEGNPLFVQEVVRFLAEAGRITQQDGRWRRVGDEPLVNEIPEGLRDVIGKRLSGLSPECNRVLQTAAVIGRDFDHGVLKAVVGLDDDTLDDALDEAVRVAVVQEQARTGRVQYRFAHALIRQTLYEEIRASRRIRLHQQVARAIETRYASRLDEHAAELAEHFAHSSDSADLEKAVRYGELAAQRAMSVYAYGEAVRHLEHALEVQDVLDPDDKLRRCDLLLALGEALGPAGEPERVFDEVATEALGIAEQLNDAPRASRSCQLALRGMFQFGAATMFHTPKFREWAGRADRWAIPETPDRVRADIAVAQTMIGDVRLRDELPVLRRALALARRLDDPPVLFEAAWAMLRAAARTRADLDEMLQLADEFSLRPRHGVDLGMAGMVLFFSGGHFLRVGDRQRAELVWKQMEELGTQSNNPTLLLWPYRARIGLSCLDGELEGAVAEGQRIIARATELGAAVQGQQFAAGVPLYALLQLGREEEALATYTEWQRSAVGPATGLRRAYHCWILAALGRRDEAAEVIHDILKQDLASGLGLRGPSEIMVPVLSASVMLRDTTTAALLYPVLAEFGDIGQSLERTTSVGRTLGEAALMLGDSDGARRHYEQARDLTEKIGNRPETALIHLGLAELDAAEGHTDAAREHLAFCIPELEAMKMRPGLEKALALRARLA